MGREQRAENSTLIHIGVRSRMKVGRMRCMSRASFGVEQATERRIERERGKHDEDRHEDKQKIDRAAEQAAEDGGCARPWRRSTRWKMSCCGIEPMARVRKRGHEREPFLGPALGQNSSLPARSRPRSPWQVRPPCRPPPGDKPESHEDHHRLEQVVIATDHMPPQMV